MEVAVLPLEKKRDPRGWLVKVLMRHQVGGAAEFGEIYVSGAAPGQVRGNHYHVRTTEWFCPIQGKGMLMLRTGPAEEIREIVLDADAPVTVMVPPGVAHAFRNTGDEPLCLLAYADVPYRPDGPDVEPSPVCTDE